MEDATTLARRHRPGSIIHRLTEIAREGARQMPAAALEAEAASVVEQFTDERRPDGRRRVVRHDTRPERVVRTGIGARRCATAPPVRRPGRRSALPRTSCC